MTCGCANPVGKNGLPLVSVIIPTKDRCRLALEAIGSLQAQTYPNWEAVVIDDASCDDTWATLRRLADLDPRVRPLRRAGPLGGPHVARNQGVAAAGGEFVVFLDSDDLLAPNALASRVKAALAHPSPDCWVFRSEHFYNTPGDCAYETAYRSRVFQDVDALDAFLTNNPAWYVSSPMWRRRVLDLVGPWRTQYSFSEDLEYNIRALVQGLRYEVFAEVDHFIRQHSGPRVGDNDTFRSVSSRIRLLDDLISLLECHGVLTNRRKRLLALSAFWGAMNYITSRPPRPRYHEVLPLWTAVRDRGLVGRVGYRTGSAIILAQQSRFGVVLRELSRLIYYNYLKGRSLLHPEVILVFLLRLRWKGVQRLRHLQVQHDTDSGTAKPSGLHPESVISATELSRQEGRA